MKFLVSRTSRYLQYCLSDEPPCEGCTPEIVPNYDERTLKSPEEFDAKFGHQSWLSTGTEHCTTARGIRRRLNDIRVFVVDFSTIEELMDFVRKNGNVVISGKCLFNDMPEIEIYDDYRE